MNRFYGLLFVLFLIWSSAIHAANTKLPVPSEAAQQQASALIKEVYGEEHAAAESNEQKQALAEKLLRKAVELEDSANRFVILRMARELAMGSWDCPLAFRTIDELDKTFQVDAVKMKESMLDSLSKDARSSTEDKVIAEQALRLVDPAMAKNDFETAKRLVSMALAKARKTRDRDLLQQSRDRLKDVREYAKAYEEAQAALMKLEEKPTDTEANLVVGKFRCFVKRDWENGLPMLALGSEPTLKALAIQELEGVSGHSAQLKLGDGWWSWAQKNTEMTERQSRQRAAYWYRKALPGLSGLAKVKVAKRLHGMVRKEPDEESADDDIPFADIVVVGSGFQWGILQEGGKAFSNRKYVWQNVPKALTKWKYTMTAGGVIPQITLRANTAGKVLVSLSSSEGLADTTSGAERGAWNLDKLSFTYNDKSRTRMAVFWRTVRKGEVIHLPHYTWTGTIVLVPPR